MAKSTDEPSADSKSIHEDTLRLAINLLIECVSKGPPSLLVSQEDAPAVLGLRRRKFFLLKSAGELPLPVDLGGERGIMYRRADLLAWVMKLKSLKS